MNNFLKTAICLLLIGCYTTAVSGQTTRTITGIVRDDSGVLFGVSIIVKGTAKGCNTDINGKYSIEVPENATLRFSYLGFPSKEVAVEGRQVIDVVMDKGETLEPAMPIDMTTKQNNKANVDNIFAFKMFKEISKQQGENTFFSPFSLNMALGMLYNGSSGNTRDEMTKTLGINDFTKTEINEYYKKIYQDLLEIDPTTNITINNSIMHNNNLPVKSSFIETSKNYFIANVAGDLQSDKTAIYLSNYIYFKGKWQNGNTFDDEKTKLEDFTKTNKQKKKVNLMDQTTFLSYYDDENLQCVELQYGNNAFSMIAILPQEKMNINQLIEYLTFEKWQNIVSNMKGQKVWLKLPRFKIECKLPLNQPVKNLGMNKMFFPSGDFTNIANVPVLYVEDIEQKTFVEVNEKGTEASSLTEIVMVGYGRKQTKPDEPVRFFADRPFLFLIMEKSSGVILFIGRLDEPFE